MLGRGRDAGGGPVSGVLGSVGMGSFASAGSGEYDAVVVATRRLPSPLPFVASTSTEVDLTGLWEKDVAASQVQVRWGRLGLLRVVRACATVIVSSRPLAV